MLPIKYTSSNNRSTKHPSASLPQPPLGITGVICTSHKLEIPSRGQLHYTVYRPRMLSRQTKIPSLRIPPPLVCASGGPGLPSQYLTVLVHHITDRAVILFDALGCGQSTCLPQAKLTVKDAASDLLQLIHHVFLKNAKEERDRQFHLLGHSYGGIVCFEALQQSPVCQQCVVTLVLSNTPHNVAQALERRRLFCETYDEEEQDMTAATAHFQQHECRCPRIPLLLEQSLQQIKSSRQYDDWETYATTDTTTAVRAALLLTGQYDYVTDCHQWKGRLGGNVQTITLANTSHFSMVEDEGLYGTVVSTFLREWDVPNK